MGQIKVMNLSFRYDGSTENLFEDVSFTVDTAWRLGFIGRNGKGKTTFLKLLLGLYPYAGTISAGVDFEYFPLAFTEDELGMTGEALLCARFPEHEPWRVLRELNLLGEGEELLSKPLRLLSPGQRAKFELAVLFSGENGFLLIDEPTNHLDAAAREKVKDYLASQSGFILVSHDRDFLDACVDHILSLNKKNIDVQKGNYSVWWENKQRRDAFAEAENEKHEKEIRELRKSARRMEDWADKSESAKIGVSRSEKKDRPANARTYIGSKTKKLQKRAAAAETRIEREIEEKEGLLNDVEFVMDLKLRPLEYRKEVLVEARGWSFRYAGAEKPVIGDMTFELRRGERVLLKGANGCGKSTLLKRILVGAGVSLPEPFAFEESGVFRTAPGLIVSRVSQDTAGLRGSVPDFCAAAGIDRSLFCTILYQMGLRRAQFEKDISEFSDGQKKKVLCAASLCAEAHLYIWDEPLNFIDVFSREQIENLILKYRPTMIFAEHDVRFGERVATRVVEM